MSTEATDPSVRSTEPTELLVIVNEVTELPLRSMALMAPFLILLEVTAFLASFCLVTDPLAIAAAA